MRIDYLYNTKNKQEYRSSNSPCVSDGYFWRYCCVSSEHHHEGANITKLGDALWWAVVTVATVGYGDYYPD